MSPLGRKPRLLGCAELSGAYRVSYSATATRTFEEQSRRQATLEVRGGVSSRGLLRRTPRRLRADVRIVPPTQDTKGSDRVANNVLDGYSPLCTCSNGISSLQWAEGLATFPSTSGSGLG